MKHFLSSKVVLKIKRPFSSKDTANQRIYLISHDFSIGTILRVENSIKSSIIAVSFEENGILIFKTTSSKENVSYFKLVSCRIV